MSETCFGWSYLTVDLSRWISSSALILPFCPQLSFSFPFRLVIYGQYCSGVESAISSLDYISKTKEDVKLKLEVPVYFLFVCVIE